MGRRIRSLVAALTVGAIATVATGPSAAAFGGWVLSNAPSPAGSAGVQLHGVGCVGTECWAVGEHDPDGAGVYSATLIDHRYKGQWSIVSSPTPIGDNGDEASNVLIGVTCVKSNNCWAVGWDGYINQDPQVINSLIEHWDGSVWSLQNTSLSGGLTAVSCPSSSDCWAVGFGPGGGSSVVEHYDGTAWSLFSAPDARGPFRDVKCLSASDCWAVGNAAEHFDGRAWSIINSAAGYGGISCLSHADCWAVHASAIDHWNGTTWSAGSGTPLPGTFLSITCVNATSCFAAGFNSNYQTAVAEWDGTSWSVVPSANRAAGENILERTACGTLSCWAVGSYYNKAGVEQALALRADR